jgi:hypothetical protein
LSSPENASLRRALTTVVAQDERARLADCARGVVGGDENGCRYDFGLADAIDGIRAKNYLNSRIGIRVVRSSVVVVLPTINCRRREWP